MLPWKNLECRRMLKQGTCFWKQRNCTWAEIQLFVAKSLFQVESWSNWVIRDSSLHFPASWGILALSGLQDGALEKDLEQPSWAKEQETPEIPPRMRFPKESALHRLQQRRKGIKRLIHWLKNSPKLQSLLGWNNLKYLEVVLWWNELLAKVPQLLQRWKLGIKS